MSGYPPPTIANVNVNTNQVEIMGFYPDKNQLGGQALKDVAEACGCLSTNPIFREPYLPAAIKLVGGSRDNEVTSSSIEHNHQQLQPPQLPAKPSGNSSDRGI